MPVLIVMAALSAGTALTVWNAPEVMIGGEIVAVRLPAPSELALARTVKVWSRPVDCFVFGFTAKTFAMVNTSPAFRRAAAAAVQPSVISDCDQVSLAAA